MLDSCLPVSRALAPQQAPPRPGAGTGTPAPSLGARQGSAGLPVGSGVLLLVSLRHTSTPAIHLGDILTVELLVNLCGHAGGLIELDDALEPGTRSFAV